MRNFISKINDWVEDGFRRICAPMNPGTRMLVIVILVAVFAVMNFYIMFRAIYTIGREDEKWEQIDSGIKAPDFELAPEEPEALKREMEDIFYGHFNSEENDRAAKG
jgi:hypothetical protein